MPSPPRASPHALPECGLVANTTRPRPGMLGAPLLTSFAWARSISESHRGPSFSVASAWAHQRRPFDRTHDPVAARGRAGRPANTNRARGCPTS